MNKRNPYTGETKQGETIFRMNFHPELQEWFNTIDFSNSQYPQTCCLCNRDLSKHSSHPNGCNPDPVSSEGRCCSECDELVVLPTRVTRIKSGLHPLSGPYEGFIGWGPNGIRYWESDGYSVEHDKSGRVIKTQLFHNGELVSETRVRTKVHKKKNKSGMMVFIPKQRF